MRREQDGLLCEIADIEKATPAPVDQAIDMLRPTSRAGGLILQQPASEQRRLLQKVVEKAASKDGESLVLVPAAEMRRLFGFQARSLSRW